MTTADCTCAAHHRSPACPVHPDPGTGWCLIDDPAHPGPCQRPAPHEEGADDGPAE